jgi:hypothetical protein
VVFFALRVRLRTPQRPGWRDTRAEGQPTGI